MKKKYMILVVLIFLVIATGYFIRSFSKSEPDIKHPSTETSSLTQKADVYDHYNKPGEYWTLPEITYYIPTNNGKKIKTIIIPSVSFKKSGDGIPWQCYCEGVYIALHKENNDGIIDNGVDKELLPFMQLKKGNIIADVGAGSGTYVFKFSQSVGESGRVYTTDIDPNSKFFIEWRIKLLNNGFFEAINDPQGNFRCYNVICRTNTITNVNLPEKKFDWIFFNQVHCWNQKFWTKNDKDSLKSFANSVKKALKKGGRIMITEHTYPDGLLHGNIPYNKLDRRFCDLGFKIIKKIKLKQKGRPGWGNMIYILGVKE